MAGLRDAQMLKAGFLKYSALPEVPAVKEMSPTELCRCRSLRDDEVNHGALWSKDEN